MSFRSASAVRSRSTVSRVANRLCTDTRPLSGIDELLLEERPSSDAIAGIVDCCACTPNGQAVAPPPRSVMNSRRLMPHPRLRTSHFIGSDRAIGSGHQCGQYHCGSSSVGKLFMPLGTAILDGRILGDPGLGATTLTPTTRRAAITMRTMERLWRMQPPSSLVWIIRTERAAPL